MSRSSEAAALFQQHREELGFVNRAQCEEKDLIVETDNSSVIGALLGNHCVRKPQSTVYEIAVTESHKRQGVGKRLVERFQRESQHNKLVAKCPVELPANEFYKTTGWECIDTEDGKNRDLNVWQLTW